MECNKEHLIRFTCDRAVAKVCDDFESDWKEAVEVTPDMMAKMMSKYRERSRTQSEGTNTGRSASEER
eukprot:11917407-Karenia_brevis.AAC.1